MGGIWRRGGRPEDSAREAHPRNLPAEARGRTIDSDRMTGKPELQRAVSDQVLESPAIQELHGDERQPILVTDVVNGAKCWGGSKRRRLAPHAGSGPMLASPWLLHLEGSTWPPTSTASATASGRTSMAGRSRSSSTSARWSRPRTDG